jgi:hypothetical protein
MRKESKQLPFNSHNLVLAVSGSILVSFITALAVYLTACFLIDSINDTHNLHALIISVDDNNNKTFYSDDKNVESNLNSALTALTSCRDFSLALSCGCLLIGCALIYKSLSTSHLIKSKKKSKSK